MSGVETLGRVLDAVRRGEEGTVTALARRIDIGRSSLFELTDLMAEAGLIERNASGKVRAGTLCGRIGFAACGLAPIHAHAEALLPALRDSTDATVRLHACRDDGDILLMHRRAAWQSPQAETGSELTAPIESPSGKVVARLSLLLRPHAGSSEHEAARAALGRIAAILRAALRSDYSAAMR